MDMDKAEQMAEELIKEHKLEEYTFGWNNANNTLGLCDRTNKIIYLSYNFVFLNNEERVRIVLLHEVAHALTPGHKHDEVWRKKCIEIGGDGKTRDSESKLSAWNYILECKFCDNVIKRRRKPSPFMACGVCCNKYNNGKWSEKYRMRLKK